MHKQIEIALVGAKGRDCRPGCFVRHSGSKSHNNLVPLFLRAIVLKSFVGL